MTGEQGYLQLCETIINTGNKKMDRTGTGTFSIFGSQIRFDLEKGFPLLTTKSISFRLIVSELLWFLRGDTNIQYLLKHNNYIWNEWAFKKWIDSDEYAGPDMHDFGNRIQKDPDFLKIYQNEMAKFVQRVKVDDKFAEKYGDLGSVYGKQWRDWKTQSNETIDQIADLIQNIKANPDSRRHLVTAWNPEDIPTMALPPCHTLFQFYVADGKLSCQLYQRSADMFLGVPFNIASYALLTHLIAHECDLDVGEFIHTFGDAHIYLNHLEQIKVQLTRDVRKSPTLKLNQNKKSIFDFELEDIQIEDYDPYPPLKGIVAV